MLMVPCDYLTLTARYDAEDALGRLEPPVFQNWRSGLTGLQIGRLAGLGHFQAYQTTGIVHTR